MGEGGSPVGVCGAPGVVDTAGGAELTGTIGPGVVGVRFPVTPLADGEATESLAPLRLNGGLRGCELAPGGGGMAVGAAETGVGGPGVIGVLLICSRCWKASLNGLLS